MDEAGGQRCYCLKKLEPFPACQDEKADEVMRAEQDAATWFETWISDNKCK